jgi:hypothetical protein
MEPNHLSRLIGNSNFFKFDRQMLFEKICKKAQLWMWKSGLGKIINGLPGIFGSHLVIELSGNNQMLPLHYIENANEVFAIVDFEDDKKHSQILLANSAIQVWMKSGWFSGSAQILQGKERELLQQSLSLENVYGKLGCRLWCRDPNSWQIISIHRNAACTGEKGPGQYSWVWALTTLFFFFAWLGKKRK